MQGQIHEVSTGFIVRIGRVLVMALEGCGGKFKRGRYENRNTDVSVHV